MTRVGTVARLFRYPVKSMLGESCERVRLDPRGVVGDRALAVRDADGKLGSGKTTRRFVRMNGLLQLRAATTDDGVAITFPDGRVLAAGDAAVHAALSEHVGAPVTLASEDVTSHLDAGPVHLVTTESLRALAAALPDAHVDARRFRPNLVVDGDVGDARALLGEVLAIGDEVRLVVTEETKRCVMVGMQQDGLPERPDVLRHLAEQHGACLGLYANVIVAGVVERGDRITRG